MADKKKSVFGFIKDALVEQVPESSDATVAAHVPAAAAEVFRPQPTSAVAGGGTEAVSVPDGAQQIKFKTTLQDAIDANHLDSYDYLKFKKAVQDLAADMPDEKLRFKTVMSIAKSMGASPEKLAQTANHYIAVLDEELKKYTKAVADIVESKITKSEAALAEHDAAIADHTQQIKRLTDGIATHTAARSALAKQVVQDKASIQGSQAAFVAVQSEMVQGIKNDLTKLADYLGKGS